MPQVRKTGTAWELCLDDYAYTRELDHAGWAWEFLRRNAEYQRDFRINRAGYPVPIKHVSGATLYRPQRRFLEAEAWGLVLFVDPEKSAGAADIFWLPGLPTHSATCHARPANDNEIDAISLSKFKCRRAVLAGIDTELISVQGLGKCINLLVKRGSLMFGDAVLSFFHEGLSTASRHFETMRILTQFSGETDDATSAVDRRHCKYLDYMVALDGRLAGRSYRDIAEVLYGPDRIGPYWTDDSRGYKSKVIRAAKCGLALMNGSYRDLL
jgi:hypothetical protein